MYLLLALQTNQHSIEWAKLWYDSNILIKLGWAGLFVLTLIAGILAWREYSNLRKDIGDFSKSLRGIRDQEAFDMRDGLSLECKDAFSIQGETLEAQPKEWWQRLTGQLEPYNNSLEQEGWFLTERGRNTLSYDFVVGRSFHAALYSAFPGILTGAGLTLTFLSILVGLLGVSMPPDDSSGTGSEAVKGIPALINGLSSKFVSSIIALLLSIAFTLFLRWLTRRLQSAHESLLRAIAETVPYLSTTRILLDIHTFSAKQAVSMSNFSSDFVDKFKNLVVPSLAAQMSTGVADGMQNLLAPTLERMAGSLDSLQMAIVGLESQKQESVTGEFERIAKTLEESISNALSSMGEKFRDALTGSAKDEFGNVQGTLEATRHVITEMSAQFSQMQTALSIIIAKAEETTTGQLDAGRAQTEAMASLMHGLMIKMHESAEQNLNSVQSQLMRVVSDLTDKVTGLSVDMMDAAKNMAAHSQQSASTIIEKTDSWSEAIAKRLEALLGNIENRSRDFNAASAALLEAKTFMSNLLTQNANALAQMAEASRNVQSYSTGLVGQSDALKTLSGDQARVASSLAQSTVNIKMQIEMHDKLLAEYRTTVAEYRQIVEGLHEPLGKIMQTVNGGMKDYNQSVEKNFTKIVEVADKLVPKAANLLNGQIEDLGERLGELSDVISKATERANGTRK